MNEETRVVLITIILLVIIILLLPSVYIVTRVLVNKAINEGKIDEKKLSEYFEHAREVRFRRHVLYPIKYGLPASVVLLIVMGILLREIRIIIFYIVSIFYLLICRYILKKKGRW